MPDSKGLLSQDDKDKVVSLITQKWKNWTCPFSGDSNWIVADHAVTPMTIGQGGSIIMGGANYPQVMLICKTCGYTVFINAVLVGIFPPSPEGKGEHINAKK